MNSSITQDQHKRSVHSKRAMKIPNHISITTTTMEVIIMEMILTMEMTLVRTNMTLSGRKTLASCNAIIARNLDTMHQTILRRKRTRMLEEPMEMTPM